MPDQIVSVAEIQRRARAAFDRGVPLADCPFNWHSAAYTTWCAEYQRVARAVAAQAERIAGAAQAARVAASPQATLNEILRNAGCNHLTGGAIDARNQATLRRTS